MPQGESDLKHMPPRSPESPYVRFELRLQKLTLARDDGIGVYIPPLAHEYKNELDKIWAIVGSLEARDITTKDAYWDRGVLKEGRLADLIEFWLLLKESPMLFPNEWFTSSDSNAHCTWLETLTERTKSYNEEETLLRYHLSNLYYFREGIFTDQLETQRAFEIINSLVKLHDLQRKQGEELSSEFGLAEALNLEIWDGNAKNLGYMSRDVGQFGSLPLYDSYGEESSPYEHDYDVS